MKNEEEWEFGYALRCLKSGQRVRRSSWPKGVFLFLLPAGTVPKTAIHDPALRAAMDEFIEGDTFDALASIRQFTESRKVLTGWLPNAEELWATDWIVM